MLEKIDKIYIKFAPTLHKFLGRFCYAIKYIFCCTMGVFLAIVLDAIHNSQSKFDTLNSIFKNLISYQIDPNNVGSFDSFKLITFISLCVITLTLCYISDANSIRNSFALGAGILTLLFSTTPEIIGLTKMNNHNNEIAKIALVQNRNLLITQRNNLSLKIILTGKEDNEKARIIVKSPNGSVYYNFLTLKNSIDINVLRENWYRIVVEVDGYEIEDAVIVIKSSETRTININLSKSDTPIGIQRIYRSITR